MNEQRLQAYYQLIERLLSCPNGEEGEILAANQELLDTEFLQVLAAVADDAAQQGEENTANWLRNLAAQLTPETTPITEEDIQTYGQFILEVLRITAESDGDAEVIYPLLAANTDKLDNIFVQLLQSWAINTLGEAEADTGTSIAADIVNFSNLIQQFPLGSKAYNMEIAIAGYEIALTVYTRSAFPQDWATTQNNLGNAYLYRILGERAENLELAIAAYSAALEVRTRSAFPQDWATTQNNLGIAYGQRILGERAENLELAIATFSTALEVLTRSAFPQQWAMTQTNLGNAYSERILGERAENLELAIAAYSAALEVYIHSTFPQQWATTQNNLGAAYYDRILGEKAENLELAIAAYSAALEVRTRSAFPQDWATTQHNLGAAYYDRILGKKAENLELAIAAYSAALEVYTRSTFPQQWAITQNNLASAYSERILGEKAENLELAIAAYSAALEVYTHSTFPQQWATTQNNLGAAYGQRILGEKAKNLELAIAAYSAALEVRTRSTFPQQWATTQNNLGNAYSYRILGERAENLELAIAAYSAALEVRTRSAFPQDWATTQHNLASAYSYRILGERAENLELAIATFSTALKVLTRSAFPQDWAMTQSNLGIAYGQRILGEKAKNLELAIAAFSAALEVYTRSAFPQDWAMTQSSLGIAYSYRILGERAENLELAIAAYSAALEVYTRSAFPQDNAETLSNLGSLYQEEKQFELAEKTFTQAIATVESLRGEINSGEEAKRKEAEDWNQLYSRMVEVYLALGRNTEAIEYVERSKTRNLVELILERDFNTIFPADVIPQLEKLRDEIAIGQNQIQTGKAKNTKELAQHLQKLRQQRNKLQDEYLPVGYGFNFKQFQGTLDEQTAIIEWYITNTTIETFIVTKSTLQRVDIADRDDNLAVLINWSNEYLAAYNEYRKDKIKTEWKDNLTSRLNRLAEILHLEEAIKLVPKSCSRLIFIPHRYLHLFPIHAIPLAEGGFLCDKFSQGVSYAPSCQILQQLQKRNRPNFESLFAIQNPTEDLFYTDLEIDSILNLFPSHQVLPNKQATKDELIQKIPQLKDANYLHFSCHGSFNFNSPQNSCLLLAESVDENNKLDLNKCLTLGDLFERNFQLDNCRLVVLSACETGLVDFRNRSDEYISLPSGFLYAGSIGIVSSLWAVKDLSTAFLMIKFSQNLQAAIADNGDFSVAIELQKAQNWLRNATTGELQIWASKLQLSSEQAKTIEEELDWFNSDEQPFQKLYYWAGFCGIGK
ncbi:MAG: CHAT domain-containing protein [Calothrix sp. MO_192.B10]|nr:CHAT domain-containing protein [Calothrix sp. MO_192.B10]